MFGYPKGLQPGSPLFHNTYECDCGTTWEDDWDCGCDDDCPSCGADVSPSESEDITPAFTFRDVLPEDLGVGDVVKGNGALWTVEALDTGHRRKMIDVRCINPLDVAPFYVGSTKQFERVPFTGTWERLTEIA